MACELFVCFVRYYQYDFVMQVINGVTVFSWQDILRTVFYAEQKTPPSEDPDYPLFGPAKAFAVAQFASMLTSCRHSQLLSHLGAPLSSLQPCGNACDNCLFGAKRKEVDVSATAHHIVALFR